METKLTYDNCPTCPYECVENTPGKYYQAGVFCPICRRLREHYMKDKEKEMETKLTYTVEAINRPYGASESIPWGDAVRTEGLTERKAIKTYNDINRWYHPQGGDGYSGHVRIVGSDDWTYTVEPPAPGERATLQAMYHLDDL